METSAVQGPSRRFLLKGRRFGICQTYPKKPGRSLCPTLVDPQKVPPENGSEREHGAEDDGRRRKRVKAEIGPMTTNRKSDRIGRPTQRDYHLRTVGLSRAGAHSHVHFRAPLL